MDNSMEVMTVKSAEQFLSPCSSNVSDVFGDSLILPRVGDQYQAEIPPLLTDSKSIGVEVMTKFPNHFALGLEAIPIIWGKGEARNIKAEPLDVRRDQDDAVYKNCKAGAETSEDKQNTSNNQDGEVTARPSYASVDNGERRLSTHHLMTTTDKMDVIREENKIPLPCSQSEPWSACEHDSFLHALYFFGKNLALVKRFVKTRGMGDILSYYYGKFYRSYEHRRWSEGRKMRNRRCVHGQKIFTGWRQQELLSRLFCHVSEECQNILREVTKAFGEGHFPVEDYIFSIKDIVGINNLAVAVSIGKGKQDLTGIGMDHVKTNNILSVRPDIPIGKAWSSLTSDEIIKFLTGDFRLSKARSNDLFWEAVWPRLLARGWHSEQPKDHAFGSSKHPLVFLLPGVKKFSRSKLVKGNHYFDSVSDVLNRVASDPGLLEIESEAPNPSGQTEGYHTDLPVEKHPVNFSNNKRHYLQPLVSNGHRNLMKFTIVDTSLIHEGSHSKVTELRTLPVDSLSNMPVPTDLSIETEHDSSDESQSEAEETTSLKLVRDATESLTNSPEITSIQSNSLPNGENHEDWSTGVSSNKQLRGTMKFQSSDEVKSEISKDEAPIMKQQQTTTAFLGESSHIVDSVSTDTNLNEEESPCCLNSPYKCESTELQVGLPQISSGLSDQGITDGNCLVTAPSSERPQPEKLIDLNLPHVPRDPRTDETFITDKVPEATQQSSGGGVSLEHEPALIGRRQSKRNRPLTTKALEAIAYGFLSTTKRKKKSLESVDVQSQSDSASRALQLTHGNSAVTSTLNAINDVSQDKIEDVTDGSLVLPCKVSLRNSEA